MKLVYATMVMLALSVAMPTWAQTAPPSPPVLAQPRAYSAAEKQLGVEIAMLLNSREDAVKSIQKAFGSDLAATLATQPTFVQLEKEYPGIGQALGAATGKELAAVSIEALPTLWADLGAVYAETFDLGELQTLLTFYRSPAGKSMISGMYQNMDAQALVKKGLENPGADLTTDDLKGTVNPAAAKAAMQLSAADRQAMMSMMVSPLGRKLMAVSPRLREVGVAWNNHLALQYGPRIEAAVANAGAAFIATAKVPASTGNK